MFASSNHPPPHHHHPHHHHPPPPPHHYSLKLKSMFELAVAQQQQYLYPGGQQYPAPNTSPNSPSRLPPNNGMEETGSTSPGVYSPEHSHKSRDRGEEADDGSLSPPATRFPFPTAVPTGGGRVSSKNSKAPTAFSIESLLAQSNPWREATDNRKKDTRFSPYPQPPSSTQPSTPTGGSSKAGSSNSNSDKDPDKGKATENLGGKGARRPAKSKRVRTIFTPEQLERLEAEFERQQYMVGPERLYLASSLYLTEAQVKVWFQNRRIKWRKQHLEMEQQRLAIYRTLAEQDMLASSSPSGTPGGASTAPMQTSLGNLEDEDTSSSRGGDTELESVVGEDEDSRDFEDSQDHPTTSPPNPRLPLHLSNNAEHGDHHSHFRRGERELKK